MRQWWLPAVLLAAGLAVAGGAVATLAWDAAPAPAPTLSNAPPERLAARADRRKARGERRARRPAAVRDPKLPSAERSELRDATRDDQLDALLTRIEEHADAAGWPEDDLAATEEILAASTESISASLRRVDEGLATWEEVRPVIRDERLASADDVRALLGDARFQAMAQGVGLERFLGDEPVRGRLSAAPAQRDRPRVDEK